VPLKQFTHEPDHRGYLPLSPLAFLLSPDQSGRWLVGAVGIENNNIRNFKDLRGMTRNAKSLKRDERARKGILIAPSKLPRFSSVVEILTLNFFVYCLQQQLSASGQNSRHGWQAGKLYTRSLGSVCSATELRPLDVSDCILLIDCLYSGLSNSVIF
jgi:hypothetical protein